MLSSVDTHDARLPVTIITGFLGSGKTTLINHILKEFTESKVAVLVNEFGDINIDSQFLVAVEQDMVELTNGCICCTINDDLMAAVYRILKRRDAAANDPAQRLDYLIVETTGIADPLPITLTFLGTELRDLTRLDSIVTLVDAETFTPGHFDSQAALSQIVYGDVTLLNKTDLVSSDRIAEVEQTLYSLKADAKILRIQQGQAPLPLIMDVRLGAAAAQSVLHEDEHAAAADSHEHEHHEHHEHDHHGHDHDHHEHDHHGHAHHHSSHLENDGFMSVSFQCSQPLALKKFQRFLDYELPEGLFRMKGVVWFQESQARHLFQLTGKRFQLQDDVWHGPRGNQLVCIGRQLPVEEIQQKLWACVAEPDSAPAASGPRFSPLS